VLILLSALAAFVFSQSAATKPLQGVTIERFTDLSTPWGYVTQNRYRPRPALGDDQYIWQPATATVPPFERWASGGGIWEIVTRKYGRGFKVICTDEMTTPWGGKTAFLADVRHLVQGAGYTEDWSGKFMFPSAGNRQGFPRHWHAGVLWEFHTQSASGHNISIDGRGQRPRLRFAVHDGRVDGDYRFSYFPKPIRFDHWYSWRLKVKWSYGDDGFVQGWLNGRLMANVSGPTLLPGEHPYLQFGFYSVAQLRNEVWHAAISRN
jgi:hypothetical protein